MGWVFHEAMLRGRFSPAVEPWSRPTASSGDTPQRSGFGEQPAGVLGPAAIAAPAGPHLAGAFGAPLAARRRVPPRAMRGLIAAFIFRELQGRHLAGLKGWRETPGLEGLRGWPEMKLGDFRHL